MANYNCVVRSNYFSVKDAEEFRSFMKRVRGNEDNVSVWEELMTDGTVKFGFGCYGGIAGVYTLPAGAVRCGDSIVECSSAEEMLKEIDSKYKQGKSCEAIMYKSWDEVDMPLRNALLKSVLERAEHPPVRILEETYDDEESDYDAFLERLQEMVAEDDAVIIMEAGYEKLRYVVGDAFVITSKGTQYINAKDMAIAAAKEMLKNKAFKTKCEY